MEIIIIISIILAEVTILVCISQIVVDVNKLVELKRKEATIRMLYYDVKIYKKDIREGPTVRGLTYAQKEALVNGLNEYNVNYVVKTINKNDIRPDSWIHLGYNRKNG